MATRFVCVIAALVLLTGCGSGAADKTGGAHPPVVLTIADSNNADQPDTPNLMHFAAEVARRSHGSLKLRVVYGAAGTATPQVEKRVIRMVQAGRYDMGWIGARAWDLVGVRSLRALQAPFLITSERLFYRVVTSPMASEMLGPLDDQGVVGLALVPDYLRHPIGMTRPLAAPADFSGARIRIQPSLVTAALMRAWHADPVGIGNSAIGYAIGAGTVDGQDGSMFSSPTPAILTLNVVLYPKALTPFIRKHVYERLSDDQQRVLRAAADDTVRNAIALNGTDAFKIRRGDYCAAGRRIVLASPAARAGLAREARPVNAWLERDRPTKRFIERIRALARTTPREAPLRLPPACTRPAKLPQAAGAARSPAFLDGTYRWVITLADARKHDPGAPHPGETFPFISTAVLRNGTWRVSGPDHDGGTFTVHGTRVKFDWPRVGYSLVFSFTRDPNGTIHLKPVLPMEEGDQFVWASQPWQRIGPPTTLPQ